MENTSNCSCRDGPKVGTLYSKSAGFSIILSREDREENFENIVSSFPNGSNACY
jgi:hypothetical protein